MTRQLNVRSDYAYEAANRLSRRMGKSTTAVVETALDQLERSSFVVPTYDDLTPEQKAHADQLLALARRGQAEGDPLATSDHNWLYDDAGLPK
jgi:hypothetical protein